MVHLVQHFVPIAHHLTVIWLVRGRRPTCPAELCHSTGVGVVVCRVNDERTSDRGRVLMCKGSLESNPIERGSDAETWVSCRDGQARCKTDSKAITNFRPLTHYP